MGKKVFERKFASFPSGKLRWGKGMMTWVKRGGGGGKGGKVNLEHNERGKRPIKLP